MARLFVANCTRQNKQVFYRLDFNEQGQKIARNDPAKSQTIPAGRQINLGGDLHITQIETIIDQLKAYGMVGASEVRGLKKPAPYIFNVDKAIKPDEIRMVMAVNNSHLIAQGRDRRRKAAIVANDMVTKVVGDQFMNAGINKDPAQDFEVEFEQLEQSDAGERRIEEGYKIDHNAKTETAGKGGGKRGKK